ncbi:MAG: 30S ribosomal protein S2 [bacterium]
MKIMLEDLLKAGVHFGHKSERWNPKMEKYIFTERNGIYIIDLIKTLKQLKTAHDSIMEMTANGGDMIFVGTKKQAKDIIKQEAEDCGAFYIHERWPGGLLTNFKTVKKTLRKMKEDEKKLATGGYDHLVKKERLQVERNLNKKKKFLDGVIDMKKAPDAIFVIDTKKHNIAIHEANLLGIPVIAITDTNSDPDSIDLPIPGNDDAIKSIELISKVMSNAVNMGKMMRKNKEDEKKARREKQASSESKDKRKQEDK